MRRLLLAPPVLVFALVPVGCGGSADVTAPPSTPPPVVSSGPTSPTASAKPESAKAFIRRWEAAGDAMQITGATAAFSALSSSCSGCDALVDRVRQIYAGGGVIKFSGTTIAWIHQKSDNVYDVREVAGPTRYRESPTAAWTKLKGGSLTAEITLVPRDGSWLVTDYDQLAGSAS